MRLSLVPLLAVSLLAAGCAAAQDTQSSFNLSTSKTFAPGEQPQVHLYTHNVDALEFRVYRVKDPVRFMENLRELHSFGPEAGLLSKEQVDERTWLERFHDWKNDLWERMRQFFRHQFSREARHALHAQQSAVKRHTRIINEAEFAQVPLLNPSQLVARWRQLVPPTYISDNNSLAVPRNGGVWWDSTEQTAMVLFGLVDYLDASHELNASPTAQMLLNGHSIGHHAFTPDDALDGRSWVLDLSAAQLQPRGNTLEISRSEGNGRLYWSVRGRYFSTEKKDYQKGKLSLNLTRDYFTLKPIQKAGRIVYSLQPFQGAAKVGDVLAVHEAINGTSMQYLLLEDPIPGGTEFVTNDASYEIDQRPAAWYDWFTLASLRVVRPHQRLHRRPRNHTLHLIQKQLPTRLPAILLKHALRRQTLLLHPKSPHTFQINQSERECRTCAESP